MVLNENHSNYDVVVIGGGPAGSTLATFLVKQKYSVLLLEREKFPRFHIGESLLPATQVIWEKLGLTKALENLAEKKYKDSAEFRIGLNPQSSDYEYARIDFTEPNNWPEQDFPQNPYAYQVERSEFDLLLLNNSRQQGVTVCEKAIVKEIIWEGDRATGVRWRNSDGLKQITKAKCIADCSGRQALIARSQKLLVQDPVIKTSAVFGHFQNVTPNAGREQGAITVNFLENGWIWFIPLHSNMMSVGVVVNQPESDWWRGKSPQDILLTYINRYKFLRTRFESAEQVSKIRILHNLSYASSQIVGNGWLLVGDANFFVDPFLSSGVQVAFKTAEQAAIAIDKYIQHDSLRSLKVYENWCKKYQFHVFVTMRLFYRMMRYQFAMQTFINAINHSLKTKPNRLERGFIAWTLGNFDRYYSSVYLIWIVFWTLIIISKIRHRLFREQSWSSSQVFCSETELKIENSNHVISP
ncbi:MAG: NAD(P)/FAD-dependent oxidoreductase [Cyanobacteria bacterium P01_F01_bin.143]